MACWRYWRGRYKRLDRNVEQDVGARSLFHWSGEDYHGSRNNALALWGPFQSVRALLDHSSGLTCGASVEWLRATLRHILRVVNSTVQIASLCVLGWSISTVLVPSVPTVKMQSFNVCVRMIKSTVLVPTVPSVKVQSFNIYFLLNFGLPFSSSFFFSRAFLLSSLLHIRQVHRNNVVEWRPSY